MERMEFSVSFYSRALLITSIGTIAVSLCSIVPYLNRPLWLDELLLAELTSPSISLMLKSSLQTANHSAPYLLYVKAWRLLFGDGVIALRSSSFIPSLLAAIFCFRLSYKLLRLGLEESVFCTATFFCLPITHYGLTNFRPYGLALLGILASLYYCFKYTEHSRDGDLILSCLFFSVSVYCQYVYAVFGSSILLVMSTQSERPNRTRGIVFFLLITTLCLTPIFFHFLSLARRSNSLTYVSGPSVSDLVNYFSLSPFILFLFALPITQFISAQSSKLFRTLLVWTIYTFCLPLFLFYTINRFWGVSLFLSRYLFWSTIPAIFLISFVISKLTGLKRLAWSTFIVTILICRTPNARSSSWPPTAETASWQLATEAVVDRLRSKPNTLVVAQTGFIESNNLSFLQSDEYKNYLLSPLRFYGFNASCEILPKDIGAESRVAYVSNLIERIHQSSLDDILLITIRFSSLDSGIFFATELMEKSFTVNLFQQVDGLEIYGFQRTISNFPAPPHPTTPHTPKSATPIPLLS